MTKPASNYRIRRAAIATLGLRALTADALASELEAAGIDLGRDGVDRLEALLESSSAFIDLEDRWVATAATLDGTRWVTTVAADRPQPDALPTDPDLGLLQWWGLDNVLTLGDSGEPVVADATLDAGDYLEGPTGWLDGYSGRNVEVWVEGTKLHFAVAEAPVVPPELADAVRATFEQHAQSDQADAPDTPPEFSAMGLNELLWEALVANRAVFVAKPIPPADLLLDAAGLMRDEGAVVRAGTDLDALHAAHKRALLAMNYALEGEQILIAELAIGASLEAMANLPEPLGPPEEVSANARFLATALTDVRVCDAVFGWHVVAETPPLKVAEFARAIVAALPPGEGAGPRWLEGRALDLDGDAQGARAAFDAAVATGEEHPLALVGLAGFRADAGDALEAVALLMRTGIDPESDEADDFDSDNAFDLLEEVAEFARRPMAQTGRNAPCPCGSGRKYKSCHLGKERHPLVERGPWLYAKANRFVRDHDDFLVYALATELNEMRGLDPWPSEEHLARLVADIALCEGGLGEAFVAQRDAILPDDEAMLAARWQLVERTLFEVEESGKESLTLRDLRSGERITITNTNPEFRPRIGDLMLGRPLPIGETWRAYSGLVKVGLDLRDEALEVLDRHDPIEVVALIGDCLVPPTLTSGDSLQLHELVWRLPDPEAARRALDASGALTDALEIDGHELHGEALSARQADELVTRIGELIPDAELIDHEVREIDEGARTPRDSDGAPAKPTKRADPADDVRDDIVEEIEQRWLDEPVPALGGLTPREAALDPIGRYDVERLLDSFEGRSNLMNIARLRKALDL